jgi:hypothetical protein
VEISSSGRRARTLADLLAVAAQNQMPGLLARVSASGVVTAFEEQDGLELHFVEAGSLDSSCSVAGSSNKKTGYIQVVEALSSHRESFTAIHELGHILGYHDGPFSDALFALGSNLRASVEEDACEAFAARVLLSDEAASDQILSERGLTARGFAALCEARLASREASAVHLAHRLASPGYVLLGDENGLRFAARSGDVFPLRRGSDQSDSDLRPLFSGAPSVRQRGRLAFPGGSFTDELYLDAVVSGRYWYAIAQTDSPDWPVLHVQASTSVWEAKKDFDSSKLPGHCSECGTDFRGSRMCRVCEEPFHDEACGRCSCVSGAVRGERYCPKCYGPRPSHCFPSGREYCEEH